MGNTFWKFTTTDSLKSILKSKSVRVCPAIDLNDPGEFKYNIDSYSREDFDKELFDPAIFPKLKPLFEAEAQMTLASFDNLSKHELDEFFTYIARQVGVLRENTKRMPFDLSRLFGVFSCSIHSEKIDKDTIYPIDNPIMWSHYAQNHHGVAFSISEDLFEHTCIFDEVGYQPRAPMLKPSLAFVEQLFPAIGWNLVDNGNFEKIVCTKHLTWKYEAEYRALFPLSKATYIPEKDLYLAKIKPEVLGTVVFGCRTSERDIREIVALAKSELGRELDFVKAWDVPNSYSLQRIPFPSPIP